jgi:hypothetical protein
MRRLDQSTNKITAMFTESGLSVIQFLTYKGCQVYGYAV